MIKNFFKKITGIKAIEDAKAQAQAEADAAKKLAEQRMEEMAEAERQAVAAKEAEELAKMSPKDRATKKGEPWIAVLETHVNKDNIRNGFFELDWNAEFVLKLKQEGYGFDGDKDEEIVDRWFRELCANVVVDEGINVPVSAGVINMDAVKNSLGK